MFLDRPIARKIARNVFWMGFERVFRLVTALLVAIALARFLGPDEFGLLNLALAFVSIFSTLAALGLSGVVPKELVQNGSEANKILGSAFIIKIAGAVFFYVALVMAAFILTPQNQIVAYLAAIIGFSMLFKSTNVINYWFEAEVDSRAIVWIESFILFGAALLKIVLCLLDASLLIFALVILSESILFSVAAVLIYSRRHASVTRWTASHAWIRRLALQSWPLIISSAAWILYTRIDQIMIGRMIGNEAVGHYTAATRLSDATSVLPAMLVVSIVPAITNLRDVDRKLYLKKFQVTYDLVFGISAFLSMAVSLGSTTIIHLAFGSQYAESATVLAIHAWAVVFISMAVVSGRFLINEGLQILTMFRHIVGMIINVVLNYWFIGLWGIKGAAMATLTSLVIANYLIDAFHPSTRTCFVQKTKSFVMAGVLHSMNNRYVPKDP